MKVSGKPLRLSGGPGRGTPFRPWAHDRPDDHADDHDGADDARRDASTASTPFGTAKRDCPRQRVLVFVTHAAALHPRRRGARRRQAVIHVEAVAGELRAFRHVLPEQREVSPNRYLVLHDLASSVPDEI